MGFLLFAANADTLEDDKNVVGFHESLTTFTFFKPDPNIPNVCGQWTGVTCSEDGSRVISLRLPGLGFHGVIPVNAISRLSDLQILSLRSNGISGYFPFDFIKLKTLSLLYLQFNKFEGELPLGFTVWKNLTVVNFSNNKFNGSIPESISKLSHLESLNLANNSLTGRIPDLGVFGLQNLDLVNNQLSGVAPKSLCKFPKSVIVGNNVTLVYGNHEVPIVMPPEVASQKRRKLSKKILLGIIVGVSVIGFIVFAVFWIMCCVKRESRDGISSKLEKGGCRLKRRYREHKM